MTALVTIVAIMLLGVVIGMGFLTAMDELQDRKARAVRAAEPIEVPVELTRKDRLWLEFMKRADVTGWIMSQEPVAVPEISRTEILKTHTPGEVVETKPGKYVLVEAPVDQGCKFHAWRTEPVDEVYEMGKSTPVIALVRCTDCGEVWSEGR